MKQIQEWLGHSDISTTANIYSHLDYKSKLMSANVMLQQEPLPQTEDIMERTRHLNSLKLMAEETVLQSVVLIPR